MPHFVSGGFYEALQATANVCISIAKQEREAQMEAFQRVIIPMKSWIQEDYPRLMKDIKKCYNLKDKMDRSMASVEARKTPERVMRAQEAKNKHQLFFERVENEVMRYKAVHRHHMQCLKVLMLKSYQFERKAKAEFYSAFMKCEAEIDAGTAALKDAAKYVTVEEIDLEKSKNGDDKESGKNSLQKVNAKSDKPERQKAHVKPKKVQKEMGGVELEKSEKQTDKQKEDKKTNEGENANAGKNVAGKDSEEIK